MSYVSVLYTRWGPKTPLTDVDTARDCCCVLHQCVVHPVGSVDPLTDVDTARDCRCVLRQCVVPPVGSEDPPLLTLMLHGIVVVSTSACCTPDGIRRPPLLTLILHGIVVVSYVSVLYTRWDPKTPLTDVDTARDCRCVLRHGVVHPVGSKDPSFLTLILHGIVVVSYVSVLYTRWGPKTPLTGVDI